MCIPVVRMAERSKAPDSRATFVCKIKLQADDAWEFWYRYLCVGSNPTSDKHFYCFPSVNLSLHGLYRWSLMTSPRRNPVSDT